jgi:cell division protein FtsB
MSNKLKFFLYTAATMMLVMLIHVFFGASGFLDLKALEKEKDVLIEKNKSIDEENLSFYREIDRLKNDYKYIENIARKELGFIGKDEVVIMTGVENLKQDKSP